MVHIYHLILIDFRWLQGLICGFVSRTEADELLRSAPPGAFLLRFSEKFPGTFVIAYVHDDQSTEHSFAMSDANQQNGDGTSVPSASFLFGHFISLSR